MKKELNDFYLNKSEPDKSCLLALRSIILDSDTEISETVKYHMPCFCYRKKPVCYLWTDKKNQEPYILWVDGKLLDHPQLEAGNRARMKILRINPQTDIPISTIHSVLHQALKLFQK